MCIVSPLAMLRAFLQLRSLCEVPGGSVGDLFRRKIETVRFLQLANA